MRKYWILLAFIIFCSSCGKLHFVDDEPEEITEEDSFTIESPPGAENVQLIGGEPSIDQKKEYMVDVESLNLRSNPSNDSEIITTISDGEFVEILEVDGMWAKVRIEDMEGYVAKKYLKEIERTPYIVDEDDFDHDEDPIDENPTVASDNRMICDVDVLNIRSFASEEAEIRGQLHRDDEVEILMDTDLTRNEWVKIRFGEITGYVVKEYLKK